MRGRKYEKKMVGNVSELVKDVSSESETPSNSKRMRMNKSISSLVYWTEESVAGEEWLLCSQQFKLKANGMIS